MTIKSLLAPNKNAVWFAFFWTVLILFLSLKTPSGESHFYFPNADKLVHFTFYFVFVVLWYRYLVFIQKSESKTKLLLVFTAIFLGISIEVAQNYLTATRQADIWDAVANTIGGVIGIIVASVVFKTAKKQKEISF